MGLPLRTYPRYPQPMSANINLHLVSDSTGDTLNAVARAAVAQFDDSRIIYHRWSLIRTRFQVHKVIDGIEAEPGPVLSTLMEKGLRTELELACQRLGISVVHVLDPVLSLFQEQFGATASTRPGRQYVLDQDYFKRIDAIHYVLSHDDGQAQAGIAEADVILVGVSRSSKTPTCFYLANRGIKAANVPLVPALGEPDALANPHCPVIGLSIDADVLIDIRRNRLRMIGGNPSGAPRQDSGDYVDQDAVKAEILWSKRLCTRRGWPVIDVTRRSIEETAATIVQLMESWQSRRAKSAAEPRA